MYKLLQELKEPSVIYEEDPDNPKDPEVLVNGVGRYKLSQVKRNVRDKLNDLANKARDTEDYDDWKSVAWMLDHAAMKEMVKTIMSAEKELEERQ